MIPSRFKSIWRSGLITLPKLNQDIDQSSENDGSYKSLDFLLFVDKLNIFFRNKIMNEIKFHLMPNTFNLTFFTSL